MKIPGYHIREWVEKNKTSSLARAVRERDQKSFLLKVLDKQSPPDEVARAKRHFEISQKLRDIPEVLQSFDWEEHPLWFLLLMEDFKGESLREFIEQKRGPLEEFFHRAL